MKKIIFFSLSLLLINLSTSNFPAEKKEHSEIAHLSDSSKASMTFTNEQIEFIKQNNYGTYSTETCFNKVTQIIRTNQLEVLNRLDDLDRRLKLLEDK